MSKKSDKKVMVQYVKECLEEHANSTHKGPAHTGNRPRRLRICCAYLLVLVGTVITTELPCHQIKHVENGYSIVTQHTHTHYKRRNGLKEALNLNIDNIKSVKDIKKLNHTAIPEGFVN